MEPRLLQDLKKLLGSDAVLHEPEDLILYEYDGSVEVARPNCVVFPRTKEHIVGLVEIANRYKTPIVGRGAGTGLSGGALARRGGILAIFSKMNRILEVDVENQRAIVQPGVVNADLSAAVAHTGLHFAPDPSSQKACTIGGNVSENSGGP
ncbi:MAG TPA: FAD-binding protein, partial [Planctomycetota bacterium]|nr:FAD-binding protein [Planctomycetota bacterium]